MPKKPCFNGMLLDDFYAKRGELWNYSPARLIPSEPFGQENALTSVFLSALRLVKEFQQTIFSNVGLSKSNLVLFFREVDFIEYGNRRVDGLILVVKKNSIVDSAILEMKNGTGILEMPQVLEYIEIADAYQIPRFITVSNQFVSAPTQFTLDMSSQKKRKVSLYHMSWSFIKTVAHLLLADNDTNIQDPDQVAIMKEVVDYWERKVGKKTAGVAEFTSMGKSWSVVQGRIKDGDSLKPTDPDVIEVVQSWLQEEKDIALHLSQELRIMVDSGVKKYKEDLTGRVKEESASLCNKGVLSSTLRVKSAKSPITVSAYFRRRVIAFSTTVTPPQDKKIKPQITWIKKQVRAMASKEPELFAELIPHLRVLLNVKNARELPVKRIDELDAFGDTNKDKFLKEAGFILSYDLGSEFTRPTNFVTRIEELLIKYYALVVPRLESWIPPVPEVQKTPEVIAE